MTSTELLVLIYGNQFLGLVLGVLLAVGYARCQRPTSPHAAEGNADLESLRASLRLAQASWEARDALRQAEKRSRQPLAKSEATTGSG